MSAMEGSDVHTLTGAYVCDALSEAEREAFEAHMSRCPECTTEVAELREVGAMMAVAVSERAPAALKDAVDARIRVTRQVPPIVPRVAEEIEPERRRGVGRAWRAGWAVAAAFALVAVGLGWRAIDQQNEIDSLNHTSTQVSQLLSAPDSTSTKVQVTGGGSALLVDSRSRNEAAVLFTGLADAPAGKTYQLWLMAPDGSARSVGLMQGASPNSPVIVEGLSGEAQVGMTIEPVGGSSQPTSTPIMVAALGA